MAEASVSDKNASAGAVDHYTLGEAIGRGAFGVVYKGFNTQNGDIVAVKRISLDAMDKGQMLGIKAEIEMLQKLQHANIVKYVDSIKTPDYLYIVLEYIEGGSLAAIIKKFGRFPERLVAIYVGQVLEGIVYLHEQGVIHRDIKGANILTTKSGMVKLADFGVATKIKDAEKSNSVVGSPYWMAPEIIEMSGCTTESDVWSLGCTVVELLTGTPPYYDLAPMAAMFRIVSEDRPPMPEGISQHLEDFLIKCFQKNVERRISAKELLKHPWIAKNAVARPGAESLSETMNRIASMPQAPSGIVAGASSMATTPQGKPSKLQKQGSRKGRDSAKKDGSFGKKPSFFEKLFRVGSLPKGDSLDIKGTPGTPGTPSMDSDNELRRFRESEDGADDDLDGLDVGDFEKKIEKVTMPVASKDTTPQQSSAPVKRPSKVQQVPQELPLNIGGKQIRMTKFVGQHELALIDFTNRIVPNQTEVGRFAQEGDDDTYDDLLEADPFAKVDSDDEVMDSPETFDPTDFQKKIKEKMTREWDDPEQIDQAFHFEDEEDNLSDDDIDFSAAQRRGNIEKLLGEMTRLIGQLHPQTPETTVVRACNRLVEIFKDAPHLKANFITNHGVVPIMEMLPNAKTNVALAILVLVNVIIDGNGSILENVCLVGMIPAIIKYASEEYSMRIRAEVASIVHQMCNTSPLTLQMFIACNGMRVLVEFMDVNYKEYKSIVWGAVDGVWQVFVLQSPTPKSDFCRLFARCGLLQHIMSLLRLIHNDDDSGASEYTDKVVNLVGLFSHADAVVKAQMCNPLILRDFLSTLASPRLRAAQKAKLLKALAHLSSDPVTLDALQAAGTIPALIAFLKPRSGPSVPEMHNHAIHALYNLCRMNNYRGEEAATHGIIPHLIHFIKINSPVKQFALMILCFMAHTGNRSHKELWKHQCVDFYLDLLKEKHWQINFALDSLAVWLQNDPRVEGALKKSSNIDKLVNAVVHADNQIFLNLIEPLCKIAFGSARVNQQLSKTKVVNKIIEYLDKPIPGWVRVRLLNLIQSFYEESDDPKRLISQHKLYPLVQRLKKKDNVIIVREIAMQLEKAFMVNRIV